MSSPPLQSEGISGQGRSKQTIDQLPEIDVLWGDGKTENILVNSKIDDICLIDFGGTFDKRLGGDKGEGNA